MRLEENRITFIISFHYFSLDYFINFILQLIIFGINATQCDSKNALIVSRGKTMSLRIRDVSDHRPGRLDDLEILADLRIMVDRL